jgi:hypothetical protein
MTKADEQVCHFLFRNSHRINELPYRWGYRIQPSRVTFPEFARTGPASHPKLHELPDNRDVEPHFLAS